MQKDTKQNAYRTNSKRKQPGQNEPCRSDEPQRQYEPHTLSRLHAAQKKTYTLKATTTTPLPSATDTAVPCERKHRSTTEQDSPSNSYDQAFLRAANEDDDGYDPFSDLPPARPPLFEKDPWS